MPPYPRQPVVDAHNPFYCPSFPASAYIHNLHRDLATNSLPQNKNSRPLRLMNRFTRLLAQNVNTPRANTVDKGVLDSDSDTSGANNSSADNSTSTASGESGSENDQFHSVSSRPPALSTSVVGSPLSQRVQISNFGVIGLQRSATKRLRRNSHRFPQRFSKPLAPAGDSQMKSANVLKDRYSSPRYFNGLPDSRLLARPQRKRKDRRYDSDSENSNIRGPPKQINSIPGGAQGPSDDLPKRQTLNFDLPSSRQSNLADDPSVSPSPPEKMASVHLQPNPESSGDILVRRLVNMGIRVPEGTKEPLSIANYLGYHGLLTTESMRLLGMHKVNAFSLGPSLQEYDGLNIDPPNLMKGLHDHGSFMHLTKLSCDYAPLNDDSLVYVHGLPLQELSLVSTGISNAAIFVLTPLRHTLLRLFINFNAAINDDAMPAIIVLKRLINLKIRGTGISIEGVYRFAGIIQAENRKIRMEIPKECELHLNSIHQSYLVDIQPPLVAECDQAYRLQIAELRKNLAAHSAVNGSILTTGNKSELRDRLIGLLKQRRRDLMVKNVLEDGLQADTELKGVGERDDIDGRGDDEEV